MDAFAPDAGVIERTRPLGLVTPLTRAGARGRPAGARATPATAAASGTQATPPTAAGPRSSNRRATASCASASACRRRSTRSDRERLMSHRSPGVEELRAYLADKDPPVGGLARARERLSSRIAARPIPRRVGRLGDPQQHSANGLASWARRPRLPHRRPRGRSLGAVLGGLARRPGRLEPVRANVEPDSAKLSDGWAMVLDCELPTDGRPVGGQSLDARAVARSTGRRGSRPDLPPPVPGRPERRDRADPRHPGAHLAAGSGVWGNPRPIVHGRRCADRSPGLRSQRPRQSRGTWSSTPGPIRTPSAHPTSRATRRPSSAGRSSPTASSRRVLGTMSSGPCRSSRSSMERREPSRSTTGVSPSAPARFCSRPGRRGTGPGTSRQSQSSKTLPLSAAVGPPDAAHPLVLSRRATASSAWACR
jgi:hypothetical protein